LPKGKIITVALPSHLSMNAASMPSKINEVSSEEEKNSDERNKSNEEEKVKFKLPYVEEVFQEGQRYRTPNIEHS
jgi:hypothetical protein